MSDGRLPNLIIAGVNKAGTTSLFSYLAAHPAICPSTVKETCYYLPLRYFEPLSPLSEYRRFFDECADAAWVMESTPGYFYGGERIAPVMREQLGEARIIIVLRQPVDRLISFYQWAKSRLLIPADTTLARYIDQCRTLPPEDYWVEPKHIFWGVEGGFYSKYLPAWQAVFGNQLKIVFFDQLTRERGRLLRDLCTWLDLDPAPYAAQAFETHNKSVNYRLAGLQRAALWVNDQGEQFWRRTPALKAGLRRLYYRLNGKTFDEPIPADLISEMQDLYRPYNAALRDQLSGELPDWIAHA